MTPAQLTPVNVITGFLGSGKTTLLQRLLRSPKLGRTAVLINELGEVGLDHLLVRHVNESMVLLKSGCICCTIRGDLNTALRDLLSKRERSEIPDFDRVVIETTGLADPTPILFTLSAETQLKHHFRLSNVVTTVDAVNAERHISRNPEGVKQIAVADRVVITKTDIAEPSATAAAHQTVHRLNPAASVIDACVGAIDVDAMLSDGIQDLAAKIPDVQAWLREEEAHAAGGDRTSKHRHDEFRHDRLISSLGLVLEHELDWTAFGVWLTMLLNRHGENVLRVKGILNVEGSPTPVVINGVQHVVHPPVHLRRWPTPDRRSRIVFITRGIDHQLLQRSLIAFSGVTPRATSAAKAVPTLPRRSAGKLP